jgi:hypothetical protein
VGRNGGNSIIRSNGTYSPEIPSRRAPVIRYFEFDSGWVNIAADSDRQDPYQTNRCPDELTRMELLATREKMPFEITPFILYLTRVP